MPLEPGLISLGRETPGRVGRALESLGERLSEGATLDEALAAEGGHFPAVYRAVVQAGSRAGRLPVAETWPVKKIASRCSQ